MDLFTLSLDDVIRYHIRLVEVSTDPADVGTEGQILDRGYLEFTVDWCAGIADPFERAAFLLFQFAAGHCMLSANKRLGYMLAELALLRTPDRYLIVCPDEERDRVVRAVAKGEMTKAEVELWLRAVVKKERDLSGQQL
ncbi:MAG: Fic family protein [Methanospirillum sp.]